MKFRRKLVILIVIVFSVTFTLCYAQNYLEESNHRGMDYATQGEFEQAKKEFEEVLKTNPHHLTTKLKLKIIDDVANQNIDNKTAIDFFKGADYESKGFYNLAIAKYTKVIEMYPEYAEAYNSRGRACLAFAYNSQKSTKINRILYEQALSDFDKIIEMNPEDATAYGSRGFAYAKLGNTDMSCSDWEQACELGGCESYNIGVRKGICE